LNFCEDVSLERIFETVEAEYGHPEIQRVFDLDKLEEVFG
jgi:hypothetical protein